MSQLDHEKSSYATHRNGITYFAGDPDKVENYACSICKASMVREVGEGPTSWAEAMAQRKHRHASYSCPNFEYVWHQKAVTWTIRLSEGKDPPSVAEMIRKDLAAMLRVQLAHPTKEEEKKAAVPAPAPAAAPSNAADRQTLEFNLVRALTHAGATPDETEDILRRLRDRSPA